MFDRKHDVSFLAAQLQQAEVPVWAVTPHQEQRSWGLRAST